MENELDRLLAIIENRLLCTPDMTTSVGLERVVSDFLSGFDPRQPIRFGDYTFQDGTVGKWIKLYCPHAE